MVQSDFDLNLHTSSERQLLQWYSMVIVRAMALEEGM